MRERILRMIAGAALCLCVCLVIGGCAKPEVSEESFRKVEMGMSAQDVERIMGPGQAPHQMFNLALQYDVKVPKTAVWKSWPDPKRGENFSYNVAFDNNEVVYMTTFSTTGAR